jgi:hypothetical protein
MAAHAAIQPIAPHFLDAHAREAEHQDAEAAVRQPLVARDLAEPRDLEHRRLRARRLVLALEDRPHHETARAVEHVLDHLAIARLEDVQRQELAGEQEHPAQREHRYGGDVRPSVLRCVRGPGHGRRES